MEPEHNLDKLPKISESNIGEGLSGNIDTINMMKKVARLRAGDPLIRKLALNIIAQRGVPSNNYLDEALAIGDYVKNKVRYVRDPDGIEYLQDPKDLVQQIQKGEAQGDCDDMSLLTAALLLSVGFSDVRYRAVRYHGLTGNYNHIYVVVYDRNFKEPVRRVVLDCILKDRVIGSETKQVNGDEYQI